MRPYGMNHTKGYNLHGHNNCSICRAYPPTHGEARAEVKHDTTKELEEYLQWRDFYDGNMHIGCECRVCVQYEQGDIPYEKYLV